MARSLHVDTKAEVTGTTNRPRLLAELQFATATSRLWTGKGNLSWNSVTWSGIGSLGSIDRITERSAERPERTILQLNGVNATLLATALDFTEYRNRKVLIYLAFVNTTPAVVGDPIGPYVYLMSNMEHDDNPERPTLSLYCDHRMVDLKRDRTIFCTDEEHQEDHPGDTFYKYTAKMPERPLYWGVAGEQNVNPSGGGQEGGIYFHGRWI